MRPAKLGHRTKAPPLHRAIARIGSFDGKRKNSTYRVPAAFKPKERRGNNRNRHSFLNWIDQSGQVELPDLSRGHEDRVLLSER